MSIRSRVVAALALSLTAASAAHAQCKTFTNQSPAYVCDPGTQHFQIADLDGSSSNDLIFTSGSQNRLSVVRENGAAGWLPRQTYTVPGAAAFAIADFNGDTLPDLAVLGSAPGDMVFTVYFLINTGTGDFYPAPTIPLGVVASDLAAADLNADGLADLIYTDLNTGTLVVRYNQGGLSFGGGPALAAGAFPDHIVVADFNHDTRPDLACANFSANSLSVFINDGLGGFSARPALATGAAPTALAAGDLNGDGQADLVVANQWAGNVQVFRGTGDGLFASPQTYPILRFGSPAAPLNVALADFDRDGALDFVVTASMFGGFSEDFASIYFNSGTGLFAFQSSISVDYFPGFLAVGNIGADSLFADADTDIVVGSITYATLSFYTNRGFARIVSPPQPDIVLAGSTANLSVNAVGTGRPSGPDLGYRWRKNGQLIDPVATGNFTVYDPTLVLPNVGTADGGTYDCIVYYGDDFCQLVSASARLSASTVPGGTPALGFTGRLDVQGFPDPVRSNPGESGQLRNSGGGQTGGGLSDATFEVSAAGNLFFLEFSGQAPGHFNPSGYTGTRTMTPLPVTLDRDYDFSVTNDSVAFASSGPIDYHPVIFTPQTGTITGDINTSGRLSRGTYLIDAGVLAGNYSGFRFTPFVNYYGINPNFPPQRIDNSFASWRMTLTPVNLCPADFNGDSFVDDVDFVIFALAYDLFTCNAPAMPAGCPADLNADTFVDDTDFVLFAQAYDLFTCP